MKHLNIFHAWGTILIILVLIITLISFKFVMHIYGTSKSIKLRMAVLLLREIERGFGFYILNSPAIVSSIHKIIYVVYEEGREKLSCETVFSFHNTSDTSKLFLL